ncbi:MAG: NADH-quinone oxidoreductase subunit C [Hadesarchaea archaeon]|nr:NADH-quinone oxidoreductase subunit C [Hadesarchaea archaeon]
MRAEEVLELIKDYLMEAKVATERRIFATTDVSRYRQALRALKDQGISRLSNITGVDLGDGIEVIYHVDCRDTVLNLKLRLPRESPTIRTVTDIFPGAVLYERDLMEMLGVRVEHHPDPRRLFLPDDWPAGEYPLRKEEKR